MNKGPRIVIAMRRVFVSNYGVAAIIAMMSVWGKVWKVNILILAWFDFKQNVVKANAISFNNLKGI